MKRGTYLARTIFWLGLAGAAGYSCVELQGIEEGGGDGLIDLDDVRESLATEPFDLSNDIIPTVATCSLDLETPVTIRNLLGIDTAAFSITNMFRSNGVALDIFGDKETSDARRRCQPTTDAETELFVLHMRVAVVYAIAYGGLKDMPDCREDLETAMEDAGHPLSLVDGEASVDTPWGLAKAYVDETFDFLDEYDGWNSDGSINRKYNRVPFMDYAKVDSARNSWTPYVPKNTAYRFKCKKRWQPLMESNDLGYIAIQEHVTPHIGVLARLFGFRSEEDEEAFTSRKLSSPKYRKKYRKAANEVIEESRLMATDLYKQAAITSFDNKFISLIPLKAQFFIRDVDDEKTMEFYKLTVEVQLAMYNGLVMAWREKVRHDLPRPTSIVREKLGDKLVEAYAGPDAGLQKIRASEWEPFIRTMPHSEFPSASACLCQTFAEQITYSLGSDTIDPPLLYTASNEEVLEFASWSEISEVCGASRVWGGMHFEDAVPAGVDLCGGNLLAESISASIGDLIDGDETAAVFNRDAGELMVRPL